MMVITAASPEARDQKFLDWLESLRIRPIDTYRVDIDHKSNKIKVFQYARDGEGKKYKNEHGNIVMAAPFTIDYGTNTPPDHIIPTAKAVTS